MRTVIIYFFIVVALLTAGYGCSGKLDIAPLNILTADQVFQSESAITAYMVALYAQLPAEDFNYATNGNHLSNQTDESISSFVNERTSIPDGTWYPWWGYNYIRNVNDLIAKLPSAGISEEEKKSLLGEAKFIRAFYYFGLAKRYGGVPIIREVQNYTGSNIGELQVPRNTEKEVWDFIAADLDSAVLLLPETNTAGRAGKYAALALKSRAMLYAASVAKYGTVSLNGIAGISAAEAGKYWQAAYDASEQVMQAGKYSLYEKNTDKELNFAQLFLDSDNPEAIFSVYYQYPYKTHSYDAANLPFGIRGPGGSGSNIGPSLELVEQYEYTDGSAGKLKIKNPDGSPVYYSKITDLFIHKDPRCLATVIVPFGQFAGKVVDVQAGIYDKGVKVEAGDYSALYNPVTHKPDNVNGTLHIVGLSGFGGAETSQTGFYLRKYLDPSLSQTAAIGGASDQPWIVFRYAEILLNYAEAAIELGREPDAKTAVNQVRERAGIRLLTDAEVTLSRIRNERMVELAFENHRWWDYRRWRIADKVLNNTRLTALRGYFDVQENAYRFETGVAGRWPKTFDPKVYYERIDPAEIAKNPKLVQNPGY